VILQSLPNTTPTLRTLKNDAPAPNPAPGPEKSGLDNFAAGATQGGNIANSVMGAYNGAIVGLIGGAAVGLGGSAIATGIGVLNGTTQVTVQSILASAGNATLFAAGGGLLGAAAGGLMTNWAGKFVGGLGARAAEKMGVNPNLGRAVGTIGTGVALGTLAGLSVGGVNGALLALGAGATMGVVSYLKN